MCRQKHPIGYILLATALLSLLLITLGPMASPADSLPAASGDSDSRPPASGRFQALEAARPITGFSIVAHHISDLDRYLDSVDAIAEIGGNAVNIVTPMFQDTVDSIEIRRPANRCPTTQQLRQIIERAESHGMFTALQPIVLMENPTDGAWRGVLEPNDWSKWWKSYTDQMQHFVDLASDAGVDLFCIGSELNFAESRPKAWKKLAHHINEQYNGQLTYSANWDRYMQVDFWDMLDVISISAYFELHDENDNPTLATCRRTWAHHRDELLAFAERRDQPLLLSEVGYPTLPWATHEPWNYIAGPEVKTDEKAKAAQALGYRALFGAWRKTIADSQTRAAGLFCYYWDPYYQGEPKDTGYGVRGKPAYDIVRRAFQAIHRTNGRLARDGNRPTESDGAKPGS